MTDHRNDANDEIAMTFSEIAGDAICGEVRAVIAFVYRPDGRTQFAAIGPVSMGEVRNAHAKLGEMLARQAALLNAKPGGHA